MLAGEDHWSGASINKTFLVYLFDICCQLNLSSNHFMDDKCSPYAQLIFYDINKADDHLWIHLPNIDNISADYK